MCSDTISSIMEIDKGVDIVITNNKKNIVLRVDPDFHKR